MGQTISSLLTFETISGSERDDMRKLDFADACLDKANSARDLGDFLGSLGWLEQSLLVRAEVLGASLTVNYNHPYIANLISIGETHLSLRRFDQALIYFFRAKAVLDPLVLLPSTKHTSAATQYVNMTAGLALVLTAVTKNHHKATYNLLEGADPLRVAEQQLEQAVIRVVALEGSRAPLLVSLYHILARVYLMTNKRMAALRLMQRCLGLTLHISQTKKIFSFLSYTRNVLDTIKELTLVERVVIKIQQWYRDKRALKETEAMKQQMQSFQLTIEEVQNAVNDQDDDDYNDGNGNDTNDRFDTADDSLSTPQTEQNRSERRKEVIKKFARSVRKMSDAQMVANFFAASVMTPEKNKNAFDHSSIRSENGNMFDESGGGKNHEESQNHLISPSKKYDKERKSQRFSMMLQHQRSMAQDRSHLVSPVLMHASMMQDLGPAAASSYNEYNGAPLRRKRSSTFSKPPAKISLGATKGATNLAKNNNHIDLGGAFEQQHVPNAIPVRISEENSPFAKLQAFKQQLEDSKNRARKNVDGASKKKKKAEISEMNNNETNLPHATQNDSQRHKFDDDDDDESHDHQHHNNVPLHRQETQRVANTSSSINSHQHRRSSYDRQDNEIAPRDQDSDARFEITQDDDNNNNNDDEQTFSGTQNSLFCGNSSKKTVDDHDNQQTNDQNHETDEGFNHHKKPSARADDMASTASDTTTRSIQNQPHSRPASSGSSRMNPNAKQRNSIVSAAMSANNNNNNSGGRPVSATSARGLPPLSPMRLMSADNKQRGRSQQQQHDHEQNEHQQQQPRSILLTSSGNQEYEEQHGDDEDAVNRSNDDV